MIGGGEGHDVPADKLAARFPRTLHNLRQAISRLPLVLVYDNSDLSLPYRHIASFEHGHLAHAQRPLPEWLEVS